MTRYLLDTNHISPLVTVGHPLCQRLLMEKGGENTFAVVAPALAEFLFGIRNLPRATQSLYEWEYIKQGFVQYGIDSVDAEQSAKLRMILRQQGWQLGLVDAFIAVVAVRYDLVLLTTDKDFSSVPGLKCENWRDS